MKTDWLVSINLVANYSPHLKPNTKTSTAGIELKTTLEWAAREMLVKYLRKFRTRRQFISDSKFDRVYSDQDVNMVMNFMYYKDAEDINFILGGRYRICNALRRVFRQRGFAGASAAFGRISEPHCRGCSANPGKSRTVFLPCEIVWEDGWSGWLDAALHQVRLIDFWWGGIYSIRLKSCGRYLERQLDPGSGRQSQGDTKSK